MISICYGQKPTISLQLEIRRAEATFQPTKACHSAVVKIDGSAAAHPFCAVYLTATWVGRLPLGPYKLSCKLEIACTSGFGDMLCLPVQWILRNRLNIFSNASRNCILAIRDPRHLCTL